MRYNKAPLPFQGQKRNFIKQFNELISDEFRAYKNAVFLDAFGGSGLLSHNIKQIFSNARVIYNDFDNYSQRLANIEATNEILNAITPLFQGEKKSTIMKQDVKEKIVSIIDEFKEKGYFIDGITLSSYLLFSGNYEFSWEKLKKRTFYTAKRVCKSNLNATGYLKGVEIVHKDAIELIKEYKDTNCVLVLDPPYLQTDTTGYSGNWGLKDFLRLHDLVREPFIFFSSSNSDILEFLDYSIKNGNENFKDYKTKQAIVGKVAFNVKAKKDYMIYKNRVKGLFE